MRRSVWCLITHLIGLSSSFILEGSDTSYARFSRWDVNTTVSLEFTTNQPDGLILYTDDEGKTDFFELKLVEGTLRLRFNLVNQGTQLINLGQHLNNGLWHKVEISVSKTHVQLTVDGFVSQSRSLLFTEHFKFDNNGVFIGGLPTSFNNKLSDLTLPSVVFEPRFRGAVRNLVYGANYNFIVKPQDIIESKGLISGSAPSEACERHDPCLHGGFCISTDTGPVCDCKHIDFEGLNCELVKPPTSATFHGTEYIGYDFRESGGQQPIISKQDEISIYFKTSRKRVFLHTLLFYSGDGVDYIALTMRNGQLMLSINLGSGPLDAKLQPAHIRLDDNQWHSVRVHRKVVEMIKSTSLCHISASVDGIHTERWTLSGPFTLLSSNRVTVGGYDTLRPLNGIRGVSNFIGCLRKVEYRADTLRLNILELARTGNRLVTMSGGRIVFHCQDNVDEFETGNHFVVDEHAYTPAAREHDNPITFTTPSNSYLLIPTYGNTSSHTTSISLKLRTTEPNGLVLYSSDGSSILSIEIVEGQLYVTIGTTRVQGTNSPLNDGEWHTIKLIRTGKSGTITVDDLNTDFNIHDLRILVLGVVYLGNVPAWITNPLVWNMALGNGFVGCMKNVFIEHTHVDLVRLANSQDIGGIRPYCQVGSAGECITNPCANNGKCNDGWGRFICDCLFTHFIGSICQVDAPYLEISDGQTYEISNRSLSVGFTRLFAPTNAMDIKFRFKTTQNNAVLLAVSGVHSDFIEIKLAGNGKLRVRVRIHDVEKILTVGLDLPDNNWHVFRYESRGYYVTVYVDDLPPVSGVLNTKSSTFTPITYVISSITSPYSGILQSLTINNLELISTMRLKMLVPSTPPTIRVHKNVNNPVQFGERTKSYVTLPQLKAYSSVRIRFKFKTASPNGVLFYNGASSSTDYISIQIIDFKVTVTIGFADNAIITLYSHKTRPSVWVDVDVFWDGGQYVHMAVDQFVFEEKIRTSVAPLVIHLNGVLYVGGGIGERFHNNAVFYGCIANVDLGGESITFDNTLGNGISHGCQQASYSLEPYNPVSSSCSTDSCENGGRCLDNDHSVTCDCTMTSYTGPTCSLESTTYEFGLSGGYGRGQRQGVIQFGYLQNREPTTLVDNIALGFITGIKDGVLLRIESVKTTDYLEIELIQGKLRVTYNMYLNKDHTISSPALVTDNTYHVLKFTRNGPNATLQIDNTDTISTFPVNLKENLFNSIGVITIGGRMKELKREVTIVRGFRGIISGLVLNGLHILDMAMNGDPRVKLHGDVRKIRSIGRVTSSFPITTTPRKHEIHHNTVDYQRAAPASSSSSTTSDDLVSSGETKCVVTDDDEDNDECGSAYTDDIITPVYTPSTTSRTTTYSSTKSNSESMYFPCAEDDEDCVEYGSGDRITVPSSSTTTTEQSTTAELTTPVPSSSSSTSISSTSLSTTEEQERTVVSTTIEYTTKFTPPHPASLPPFQDLGRVFDFDTPTPSSTSTISSIDKKKNYNETVYMADSGDSTLIIIIIIAVLMIIIVSILIIFFMCKRRDDPIYKIENTSAAAAIPPPVQQVARNEPPRQQHQQQPPIRQKNNVKEWYV